MNVVVKLMGLIAVLVLLHSCASTLAASKSRSDNPLLTAPMPLCGPLTPAFVKLLADLNQRSAWRGVHENDPSELELTVGRNGMWFLFFHSVDNRNRKMVCLIARGRESRESFGRPV